MHGNLRRSLGWAPTVALSWFWGLGFFYSIHVTLTNGWLGFLAFAIPNAFGLFLFGWTLGAPGRDAEAILARVGSRYAPLFLASQLLAVSITVFAFAAYAWIPMFGRDALLGLAVLVLVSCTLGHVLSVRRLRTLHAAYLAAGLAATGFALSGLGPVSEIAEVPLFVLDDRFLGLVVPTLVGFLLGPWTDVQHWQRVVEIRRDGASPRQAYAGGALVFLGLLCVNALLAASAGASGGGVVSADGLTGLQPAVALSIVQNGLDAVGIAFLVWTAVAAASTIDSAYAATRWLMAGVTTRSNSALLAFVPASLVTSPLWIMLAAAGVTWAMIAADLSMMYLMMPYATFLVAGAACLACESLGGQGRYDATLNRLLGLTALLVMVAGYVMPVGALLAAAPVIALLGVLPLAANLLGSRHAMRSLASTAHRPSLWPTAPDTPPASAAVPASAPVEATAAYGFADGWFEMRMIPTYDDTNSVGNVYFANYVRWVGKARELFFRECMPGFDLKTTDFLVLTKSFNHEFRREAAEFEPVTVRLRIGGTNRKFVTLAHEVHSDAHGLLGRGEQTLMFVAIGVNRPLDIPRGVIEAFLPHLPNGDPLARKPRGRDAGADVAAAA